MKEPQTYDETKAQIRASISVTMTAFIESIESALKMIASLRNFLALPLHIRDQVTIADELESWGMNRDVGMWIARHLPKRYAGIVAWMISRDHVGY